jgi:oligopeptide/dipeptide ABC transporter ATP-binding protein
MLVEDILTISNLKKYFPTQKDGLYVRAVDDITFTVRSGEVVGLVGESGSGKSTTAYMVMGIYGPTAGKITFKGRDISTTADKRPLSIKKDIQIVFQDPGTSLNPQRTIGQILGMPLSVHKIASGKDMNDKIIQILENVNLPEDYIYKYSSTLGGGERQMVAIARALATNPSMIVLDEPTSALDVSVQAKTINTLMRLQKQFEMSYLFITHDLSLMRNIADRIVIMYLGKIMEMAKAVDFFERPLHPYTQMLLSSIPVVLKSEQELKPKRVKSQGEIPSPVNVPPGCRFHTRCPRSEKICFETEPVMKEVLHDHFVCCHLCNEADISNIGNDVS